jgi:hypothetical protein
MPTIRAINLLLVLIVISGSSSACSTNVAEKPSINQPGSQSTPKQRPEPTATTGSIRSVDFANFTYLGRYLFTNGPESFTLRQGRFAASETKVVLAYLTYGDVTGDGNEDAMVTLAPVLGGSATPLVTYVYSLEGDKPRLLWTLSTGDRADGGLRRIYSENGKLVVERFSPIKSHGACCPTQFTRTSYAWDGTKFRQSGSIVETLPNPTGSADTVMPEYQPSKDSTRLKS